jgi:hypothetical protein
MFETLARELVDACRSQDQGAIAAWASRWIDALVAWFEDSTSERRLDFSSLIKQIETFARATMGTGAQPPRCATAEAQLVIARMHGFSDWPALVAHVEALGDASSSPAAFEAAVVAIVTGDAPRLQQLLRDRPDLARARSTREHRATLLHYVSANGVEGYRQLSPKNSAEIAEILLGAGAEVDATTHVYEADCTTLGLVATSAPPAIAGVQLPVIDVLLAHGARTERPGLAGRDHSLVRGCLANGQPEAAEYLVRRGAPLDLIGAAGLGHAEALKHLVKGAGAIEGQGTPAIREAFAFACIYGQLDAVDFFLDRGLDVDVELRGHGEGHTGLHVAAYHAHPDVVKTLVRHGADVEAVDKTWGTPPLKWALTGWSRAADDEREPFYGIVSQLVAAGADVTSDLFEWEKVRADPRMQSALREPAADA